MKLSGIDMSRVRADAATEVPKPSPVAAELIKPTMNNKSMMRPPRPLDCLPMIGSHAALSRSDGIFFK